jgi:NAD(P)-dependent dehydrogenase (short-subunit alcohol dehydrogenase family)
MEDRFKDQVVWITGASSGIGRALATAFAVQGAFVAVSARRQDRLDQVVQEVEALGRRCLTVPCDVTDEAQIAAAVKKIADHFGRLDVAVANAGLGIKGRIEELGAEEWRRQLDVNVVGLALTARYALPHLRQTGGRLALIGSVAAVLPSPSSGAYSASKAAVASIGQTLSAELHGSNVTCTTIHPGFVVSDLARIDNQGRFNPDRKDPRPKHLMWPADKAAQVIVDAIYKRKRDYVFTVHGKVAHFIGRHFPVLASIFFSRICLNRPSTPTS